MLIGGSDGGFRFGVLARHFKDGGGASVLALDAEKTQAAIRRERGYVDVARIPRNALNESLMLAQNSQLVAVLRIPDDGAVVDGS